MSAYYNEIDPYAAQWLRNLIDAGHIAPGVVDERSIEDVLPRDLDGFTQCHFFAGIGVWSYALRRAGWPDDRPVWTGSCPCQPFSAAGQGAGFADERHLWPAFFWLIRECRPPVVIGEQVASKATEPWIDLVCDDMEALDYAFGAIPFPSAGVGAPHIRDRLYWVANTDGGHASAERKQRGRQHGQQPQDCCTCVGMEYAESDGRLQRRTQPSWRCPICGRGKSGMGDAGREGLERRDPGALGLERSPSERASTNGFWASCDWLPCRDGKARPVEPGTFPLAHGVANRVGRLRAYGNAVNAEAARVFIETVMEAA